MQTVGGKSTPEGGIYVLQCEGSDDGYEYMVWKAEDYSNSLRKALVTTESMQNL